MPRRLLLNRLHRHRHAAPQPARPLAVTVSWRAAAAAGLALLVAFAPAGGAQAASPLLESVKQNPALARQMCARFKQLNAEGQSATSPASAANASSQTPRHSPLWYTCRMPSTPRRRRSPSIGLPQTRSSHVCEAPHGVQPVAPQLVVVLDAEQEPPQSGPP